MKMNSELFKMTTDEKKALLRGIADVTGYIRKSNIAFGQEGAHRVYIEIPGNWYLVIDIANMLKDLDIPGIIIKYIEMVKNKLKSLKIFTNEEEFKIINDKIYDFALEKIYDKIFPTFQSDNDASLHTWCQKLSWAEPKNFLGENKTLSVDSFLPDVIFNFLKIEEEKSPRKKMDYVKAIFVCINQVQNFNGADGSKAGVDDIINILAYAFVKAKLEMAHTNFHYLKFFVKASTEEDQWLTQLNVVCEFILNITYEKLNVTKEEFEKNCDKAQDENFN